MPDIRHGGDALTGEEQLRRPEIDPPPVAFTSRCRQQHEVKA